MGRTDPTRHADLARIHIAKAALIAAGVLTEDSYREALWAVCRVKSSAELDFTGRKRLVEHFTRLGWDGERAPKPRIGDAPPPERPKRRATPKRPTPSSFVAAMCRKVRAILIGMGRLPDTYADAIARQMHGVEFYEWCTPEQLRAVITALVKEQEQFNARARAGSAS